MCFRKGESTFLAELVGTAILTFGAKSTGLALLDNDQQVILTNIPSVLVCPTLASILVCTTLSEVSLCPTVAAFLLSSNFASVLVCPIVTVVVLFHNLALLYCAQLCPTAAFLVFLHVAAIVTKCFRIYIVPNCYCIYIVSNSCCQCILPIFFFVSICNNCGCPIV